MAIYLRSCDSILVSYNDVLGKPMVLFGLVMCCCGWGVKILGGGVSKYYDSILTGGHLTTGSKYYTTPAAWARPDERGSSGQNPWLVEIRPVGKASITILVWCRYSLEG